MRYLLLTFGLALASCGEHRVLTEDESHPVRDDLDAQWYRDSSTPEHVAENSELRALIPPHAKYHAYQALQIKDSWVVPDSLAKTVAWYKKEMAIRNMAATLHQCTPGSIWGGWVVIIDYCSSEKYAHVVLGEDTTSKVTSIEVRYRPRRASFRCDDPGLNEYRTVNTANCPAEFIP